MDNYEKAKHRAEALFLGYDQNKMVQKFSLRQDNQYLYVDDFLCRNYRVDRSNGAITWTYHGDIWQEADFNESLTLFDILCYSKEDCHPSGEYSQVPTLVRVSGRNNMFAGQGIFRELSEKWQDRMDDLNRACKNLGGVKATKGDLAYLVPVFQGLNVLIRFYEADEEFPADLQFLMDTNTLTYMHYESVWYLCGHIDKMLEEAAEEVPPWAL